MSDQNSVKSDSELTRRRYLIVDDEPFSRNVIGSAFRALGCRKLLFATDGLEALDKMETAQERVDVVLSDFQMPNLTGLQLLKAIRCGVRGISNKTTFGLLTGYSDRDIVGAAFRLDVDCFLTKPVSLDVLRERIAFCLAQDRTLDHPDHYQTVNVDISPAMSVEIPSAVEPGDLKVEVPANYIRLGPTDIEQIEEGSILLGDLTTSSGEVILKDGQVLGKRILHLLIQLGEIDPIVQTVNVAVPDS